MKELYKLQLFKKHFLVNDEQAPHPNAFESLFSLANLFGIKVEKGKEWACPEMIKIASLSLGYYVSEPFYKGFPQSVRELSKDELLFDQLLNYFITYDLGNFSEPRYSVMEEQFERTAFKENVEVKVFDVLTLEEAEAEIATLVQNLLSSTRPLSDSQYDLVKEAMQDYPIRVLSCPCKDTAIRFILDTRSVEWARFLQLSDFIALVEQLNFYRNGSIDTKKLNLKNRDRVLLTKVLDKMLEQKVYNVKACYEKQQAWCGYLHHLHYKPKNEKAQKFVTCMRNNANQSVYSQFEKAMSEGDVRGAATLLIKEKGSAAFMRNLNYILSRCKTDEEAVFVISNIKTDNNIVLLQLLLQYAAYKKSGARNFKFTKFNRLKAHTETEAEVAKRKSIIEPQIIDSVIKELKANLANNLKNRLGKVYISEEMKKVAVPLQENASMGGFGTLPKGSVIDLLAGKKIRLFTYWEKVNDIDLSLIGLDDELNQYEFSWRSMFSRQSKSITFSGDQTSGYDGGSEYFDVDFDELKNEYPSIKYFVVCNNVYSASDFAECYCKAGYMMRDVEDSGEVFEPKTVQSSFIINCKSTFAYMYVLDVQKRQIVWLNTGRESKSIVAGTTKVGFLLDYVGVTEIINLYSFFTLLATEIVDDPLQADVVVSDEPIEVKEGAQIIRSYDADKILPIING